MNQLYSIMDTALANWEQSQWFPLCARLIVWRGAMTRLSARKWSVCSNLSGTKSFVRRRGGKKGSPVSASGLGRPGRSAASIKLWRLLRELCGTSKPNLSRLCGALAFVHTRTSHGQPRTPQCWDCGFTHPTTTEKRRRHHQGIVS